MKHLRAQLLSAFLVVFITATAKSDEGKCVCVDKNGAYMTVTHEGIVGSMNGNQVLERFDKLTLAMESLARSNFESLHSQMKELPALRNQYHYPNSCTEATAVSRRSGTYTIQVDTCGPKPFQVSCDEDLFGGGWTVVLRRVDGSIDFFRTWSDYKQGFGNLDGEFFIGLDKLYALTNGQYAQELIFVMDDFDNVRKYAKYSSFAIGDESERYVLKTVGNYTGDAGDSFTPHAAQTFKTKDVEGDPNNCAKQYTGAWWYKACHSSNLCGTYLKGAYGQEKYAQGVAWHTWRGHNYSLKFVQMMIRPKRL